MENHDVIIIGAGPAGLSAAISLRELGVKDVVVLEREAEAGGIPRHCGHFGFGWESHRRLMSGPNFANHMRKTAREIDIRTSTTVLEFSLRGTLRVHSAQGISDMSAKRVLLATGTRESSRAALMIGGARLPGVMNTGALQQLVYLKKAKPFSRPVIIGNEWVSFSALLTCRHAGIKPVAILAEEAKLDAPWLFSIGARLGFGVSVTTAAKLMAIHGTTKVEAVEVERGGVRSMTVCDGVIFSGQFRPESALYAGGFLERDGEAPRVAENFRTSNPSVFAAGNVLGAVQTSGACVVQARAAAALIAKDLK
jgi:thioredoxin reductase